MWSLHINFLAVLLAVIAGMIVGGVWYSPALFVKPWLKAIGKSADEPEDKESMKKGFAPAMIAMFIGLFVMAAILSMVFKAVGVSSICAALLTGFLLWLGFTLPLKVSDVMFGSRSKALIWIDSGNYLVSILIMSLIIFAMR